MLVLHGFADEAPLLELAARVAAGGATNLRDALRHLHSEIRFRFKDIAEADLPGELPLVVRELLKLYNEGRLSSSNWAEVVEQLRESTKLKGKKLLLPVRLALTGQLRGHSLSEPWLNFEKSKMLRISLCSWDPSASNKERLLQVQQHFKSE
eukprot:symbB.v1.2.005870.t1/scaffold335.1/size242651/21